MQYSWIEPFLSLKSYHFWLCSACKATSKSQNFVLPQANLHLLLKSHVAIRHCKYIDHPRHWDLYQGRHGLREVQWTAPPLGSWPTTELPSSSVPLVQSEDSPESKDGPSGPSRKIAQLLEGISTERRDSMASVGGIQCKQKVNYTCISEFQTSASFLSVVFVNWVFLLLRNNLSDECTLS